MIVSLFKNHRWWWTIYQSLQHDEEGKPILPYSEQKNSYVNMNLYKESFAEHNFLWTQWKKLKHFDRLGAYQDNKVVEEDSDEESSAEVPD